MRHPWRMTVFQCQAAPDDSGHFCGFGAQIFASVPDASPRKLAAAEASWKY